VVREVTLLTDEGIGSWVVLDYEDGTAQLIYRWASGGPYYRATRHVLATEVRQELIARGFTGGWTPE
jgi:hypothetical protein